MPPQRKYRINVAWDNDKEFYFPLSITFIQFVLLNSEENDRRNTIHFWMS